MEFRRNAHVRKLYGALELPVGVLEGDVNIELHGNREAVIEGRLSVLEYSDTVMRLNTGSGVVRITGTELELTTLTPECAILSGIIASLDFAD